MESEKVICKKQATHKVGDTPKFITWEEVNRHNSEGDHWLVLNGQVYDLSNYKHPGGFLVLKDFVGGKEDAHDAFTD